MARPYGQETFDVPVPIVVENQAALDDWRRRFDRAAARLNDASVEYKAALDASLALIDEGIVLKLKVG